MPPKADSKFAKQKQDANNELKWLINNYCEFEIIDESNYEQLIVIKNELISVREKYDHAHSNLSEDLSEEEQEEHFNTISKFLKLLASFNALLKNFERQQECTAAVCPNNNTPIVPNATPTQPDVYQHFRVPEISMPTFDGAFSNWLDFRSSFDFIINNNKYIDPSAKFHYLKRSLTGEALARIQNIAPGKDDFQTAWDLLSQRYENSRLIANSHITAIESPPPLKRNCAQSLRSFIDHMKSHINALENLNLKVEIKDLLYMHKILANLDSSTLKDWERRSLIDKIPTMKELWDFLEGQCKVIDAVAYNSANNNSNNQRQINQPSGHPIASGSKQPTANVKQSSHSNNRNFQQLTSCSFCKDSAHPTHRCPVLLQLQPQARKKAVQDRNLCFNCLRPYVANHACSAKSCFHCGKRHHTVLHGAQWASKEGVPNGKNVISNVINSSPMPTNGNSSLAPDGVRANTPSVGKVVEYQHSGVSVEEQQSHIAIHASTASPTCMQQKSTIGLLPTAEVIVQNSKGESLSCLALIDSGSDSNLISKHLADQLALPAIHVNTLISSVNGNESKSSVVHSVVLKSTDCTWTSTEDCITVDRISSNLPIAEIDLSDFSIPSDLKLANPNFACSSPIDLLLGAGVFASILLAGKCSLGNGMPVLQNTILGWIAFGSCKLKQPIQTSNIHVSNFLTTVDISQQLEKFWKLEEISDVVTSPDCKFVEEHYSATTTRQDDGRFVVSLPRKDNFHTLGQTHFQAKKRFHSLEKRLAANPELRKQYTEFMTEYKQLNHMSLAPPSCEGDNVYHIPHHPVFKPDSTTTKLRVVFDASAKSSTGVSLNEVLHTGPTVQSELYDVVLRFRTHHIAFISDIAKMYRQILVCPADREFQRIFWRDDSKQELQEYTLNTVSYGTAPASFLATRTLNHLADLECDPNSSVSNAIKNDFYVDDLMSGGSTVSEATELAQQLLTTLPKGGFELRKWMSNSTELLSSIPAALHETETSKSLSDSNDHFTKALGLIWCSTSDTLSISSSLDNVLNKSKFTKRELLSCIASIFDPLGLVSPIVILPKILFQQLWLLKVDWDQQLPPEILLQWLKILQELPGIFKISIPRCILSSDVDITLELHGFCDASLAAYGACIYIRSASPSGVQTHLFTSKSRVASLNPLLTVPRLELQAALLLARLVNKVIKAANLSFDNVFLWTDSKTVCDWLKLLPDRSNIFNAWRISEIQTTTSKFHWNHVRTKNNPADLISRGCTPAELANNSLWWHGPTWLSSSKESWDSFSANVVLCQSAQVAVTVTSNVSIWSNLISSCSKYSRMIRIAAYVLRFVNNCRKLQPQLSGSLSVDEISSAEIHLIKTVQEEVFSAELKVLRKDQQLNSNSSLLPLSPFLHSDQLLRVGGRLQNADINFDYQHQILLPSQHSFTKALIRDIHSKLLHAGVQSTMAALRQRFWISSTRRTIKSILKSCVKCFRFTNLRASQGMGQLPAVRVNIDIPFSNCGVDCAGPFSLRLGGPKSRTFVKSYIVLFVCMVSRAVHVEVVTELSSKAFLAALTRFIARRGVPQSMYSDNGTNFQAASTELHELHQFLASPKNQKSLQDSASLFRINWQFIPPRAPHFGGLWENAIKNFKQVFRVVTLKQILTLEELLTLSCQIEAILNSRPIVPLTEDPFDLSYLSPGHFLIGRPITALPSKQPITKHVDHLSRWNRLNAFTQALWDRWSQEYLATLQKKQKWCIDSPNVQVGILVILKDPGALPATWKLARITEIHPGQDGKVRVVTVHTSAGSFKRAITSIVPLPIESDQSD